VLQQMHGSVAFAMWCQLANMIELMVYSARRSPQPKWKIDRFSHFCTAYGRLSSGTLAPPEYTTQTANRLVQLFLHSSWQKVPILYNGRTVPQNSPSHLRNLDPRLICDSLGPSEPTIQTASRSVQPFMHRSWYCRVSLYFSVRRPFPMGG